MAYFVPVPAFQMGIVFFDVVRVESCGPKTHR